jgi:hypothetical protein
MFNMHLNDNSHRTNTASTMTDDEYANFVDNLINEIHRKYGFYRSKL